MSLRPEFEPFTLHFVKRTAATAGSCCLFTIDFSQNTLRHVISVMDSDRSHNEDNFSFQVSFIYKADQDQEKTKKQNVLKLQSVILFYNIENMNKHEHQ